MVNMQLRDYFIGEGLRLHSPMPARIASERINKAAGSTLWPFTTGVVGGVWFRNIRLRYRSSLFEYNAKPVLSGRLEDGISGSTLELRYRAPVWVYGFNFVWYLLLTFIVAFLIGGGWAPGTTAGDKVIIIGFFSLMIVAPLALHAVGTRRSQEELVALIDFLAQHIDAKR
jgi:hypothetical protein